MSISEIQQINTETLKPYETNSRMHGEEQLGQIEKSIKEFGFTIPILIDDKNTILAGHGRWNVAKRMGLDQVPCMVVSHLNDTQKRAYVIADNKIAENSEWNFDVYMAEIKKLDELDFDLSTIGLDIDVSLQDFAPQSISNLEVNPTTDKDMERAQNNLDKTMQNIQSDNSDEGTEVICPHCHESFIFTGG